MTHPLQRLLRSCCSSAGLVYSCLIYDGRPSHLQTWTRIYASFLRPDSLCFDIGAHLSDRIWAWSKLGARVIAFEPHPGVMSRLRRWIF